MLATVCIYRLPGRSAAAALLHIRDEVSHQARRGLQFAHRDVDVIKNMLASRTDIYKTAVYLYTEESAVRVETDQRIVVFNIVYMLYRWRVALQVSGAGGARRGTCCRDHPNVGDLRPRLHV